MLYREVAKSTAIKKVKCLIGSDGGHIPDKGPPQWILDPFLELFSGTKFCVNTDIWKVKVATV